jgi:hypothetical protein
MPTDWRSLLGYLDPLQPAGPAQPDAPVNPYQLLGSTGPAATPPPYAALTAPQPSQAPAPRPGGRGVVVGDSLGVGTTPYLRPSQSDTLVGRSSANGVQALRRLVQRGTPSQVVFDLGTNDPTAQDLAHSIRQARRIVGGAELFVPTVNGPNAAAKNALLHQLAQQGEINLIDWASHSRGLTGSDGIHASPSGYRQRAALIARALRGGR